MAVNSFITLAPSPLLLIEFSLLEQHKSRRGQGGGVGRAAMSTDGSQAVCRLFWAPCPEGHFPEAVIAVSFVQPKQQQEWQWQPQKKWPRESGLYLVNVVGSGDKDGHSQNDCESAIKQKNQTKMKFNKIPYSANHRQ